MVTLIVMIGSVVMGTGLVTYSTGQFQMASLQGTIDIQDIKIWANPTDPNNVAWGAATLRNSGDKLVSVGSIQVRGTIIPYSSWYADTDASRVTLANFQSQLIFTGNDASGMMKDSVDVGVVVSGNCNAVSGTLLQIDQDGAGPNPLLCMAQASGPVILNPGDKMIVYFRIPDGIIIPLDVGSSATVNIFVAQTGTLTKVIIDDTDPQSYTYSNASTMFTFLMRNGFPDTPGLTTLYQKHARSTDVIAQFTNQLLDSSVTSQIPSQKAVTYFSLADIQNNVATLSANGYTWVVYDLEPSYSPASEVADPVGSVQQASQIIHNAGLNFMLTPAGISTSEYSGMAVYTDGFVLQAQDLIAGDLTVFENTITDTISIIRTANPSTIIILQGSTIKDTPDQINDAYDLVKDKIDGITVFYNNDISEIPKIAAVLTHIDGIS